MKHPNSRIYDRAAHRDPGQDRLGKTSTEKLLVEQVVAAAARVCVLDTIKSARVGNRTSRVENHRQSVSGTQPRADISRVNHFSR